MIDPVNTAAAWGLKKLFDVVATGLVKSFGDLSQRVGFEKAHRIESVSDLWHRGIDRNGLRATAKVSVSGAISGYVPLCPGHPLDRPGRRIDLWLKNRGSVEAFTTANFIIWGDGVLVPPQTSSKLAVLGTYDKYGLVGMSSIPVIVDISSRTLGKAFSVIFENHPRSLTAQVVGRLVRLPLDLISQFGLVPNRTAEMPPLPNFAIEATSIKLGEVNPVLFGIQWISYDKVLFPIYGNLSDRDINLRVVSEMHKQLNSAQKVDGVYDVAPFG